MNTNLILQADVLDIVFENRNKQYGAYPLRKYYTNRLLLSLAFMFFVCLVFIACSFLYPQKDSLKLIIDQIPETIIYELNRDQIVPVKKAQAVAEQAKATQPVNQAQLVSQVLIVQDAVKTDQIKTIDPTVAIAAENIAAPVSAAVGLAPEKQSIGLQGTAPLSPLPDIHTPMETAAVDLLPAFPGGMDALQSYFEKYLHNPEDLANGETITVKVRFVVDYQGKLQGFTIIEDGGDLYNREVMRVLKKMPQWIPGKAKGQNVSVYYSIPVKFVMSN